MSEQENPEQAYVRRDKAGDIESLSLQPDPQHPEAVSRDAAELQSFLRRFGQAAPLARSDPDMSRVLEDLIDILIQKDVMCFTDLPEAAQRKLLDRRKLRVSLTSSLLSDDERLI